MRSAGTIAIEPRDPAFASLEFDLYSRAIAAELTRVGYTLGPRGSTQYVAAVDIARDSRAGPVSPPPFSIGLGGGSFGRRSGIGGGVTLPVGKPRTSELVATTLSVRIRRAADDQAVWEGRAEAQGRGGRPEVAQEQLAPRLAAALFQGFPGESGRTITVK
ncbi:MAG: DUF4136 domain-containing protein [Sphingomonas fennica]